MKKLNNKKDLKFKEKNEGITLEWYQKIDQIGHDWMSVI